MTAPADERARLRALDARDEMYRPQLALIGSAIGYGRSCQILGELWDADMAARGYPTGRGAMERRPDVEAVEAERARAERLERELATAQALCATMLHSQRADLIRAERLEATVRVAQSAFLRLAEHYRTRRDGDNEKWAADLAATCSAAIAEPAPEAMTGKNHSADDQKVTVVVIRAAPNAESQPEAAPGGQDAERAEGGA